MADRYFVESPLTGERAVLVEAEAHHLAHVMRARVGTEVTLFDGRGREALARVERVGRSQVELAILSCAEISREPARRVILGVALPKGDRQRWLVEKAVELGVSQLVPLLTHRGVAQPVDNALARLRRAAIEASKQCGRNLLMDMATPRTLAEFLTAGPPDAARYLAHPGGKPLSECASPKGDCWLAIGPEGGFTPDEASESINGGWQTVDLGERILRVETAALVLAARLIGD